MAAHATAGPAARSMSGLHIGTVKDASSRTSEQKKFAMVKVKLDADYDAEIESQEVWARVMSLGGSSGTGFATQFIPRAGAKVLVAYPGGSDRAAPVVLGTLMDFNQASPFHKDGQINSHTGIRTRSDRGESASPRYVHNELRFRDEKDNEEYRTVAPKYRTEATGLERDVGDEKRTYYSLKSGKDPDDFVPRARKLITQAEAKELPGSSAKICHRKPIVNELMAEYDLALTDDASKADIPLSTYNSLSAQTTVIPDASLPDKVKEVLPKNVRIDRFMNMRETSRIDRKDPFASLGMSAFFDREAWQDATETFISVEDWRELPDESTYNLKGRGGHLHGRIDGYENALNHARKQKNNVCAYAAGKDMYAVGDMGPYRRGYATVKPEKDAYDVEPHKEIYSKQGEKKSVLYHGDRARAEYTEGGAVSACQGPYQVHTFGDRIEIFRTTSGSTDVFDQEYTEDWEIDGLPGDLERFSDDNPILILSKDGSIEIQSKKGINIESAGDVNIQSGRDVNISAERDINQEAGKGIELDSTTTDVFAKQVNIGKASETTQISINSSVIDLFADQINKKLKIWSVSKGIITNSESVISQKSCVLNTVETVFQTRFSILESRTTVALDNKNTLLDTKVAMIDVPAVGIKAQNALLASKLNALASRTGAATLASKAFTVNA